MASLTSWLLDIQQTRDGVVVLGAGMDNDTDTQPQLYYGLGKNLSCVYSTLLYFMNKAILKLTHRCSLNFELIHASLLAIQASAPLIHKMVN